ncbi:MAG: hypothetical protein JWN04_2842, partial [Myxococcaceae bacterium]|nr:hypothetical protein [Myxococcaceae bacterium]
VRHSIEARGAELEYLPPYSPDLNPIEPGWALTKQYIKKMAPRLLARCVEPLTAVDAR